MCSVTHSFSCSTKIISVNTIYCKIGLCLLAPLHDIRFTNVHVYFSYDKSTDLSLSVFLIKKCPWQHTGFIGLVLTRFVWFWHACSGLNWCSLDISNVQFLYLTVHVFSSKSRLNSLPTVWPYVIKKILKGVDYMTSIFFELTLHYLKDCLSVWR
jgi:hypothetical protein